MKINNNKIIVDNAGWELTFSWVLALALHQYHLVEFSTQPSEVSTNITQFCR